MSKKGFGELLCKGDEAKWGEQPTITKKKKETFILFMLKIWIYPIIASLWNKVLKLVEKKFWGPML